MLKDFKKISEKFQIDERVLSQPPKRQIMAVLQHN